jgi:hypothetical protein
MNFLQNEAVDDANFLKVIKQVWDCSVPSKVEVFGWKLLQGHLPTRLDLWQRHLKRKLKQS